MNQARCRVALMLVVGTVLLGVGACGDDPVQPPPPPANRAPQAVGSIGELKLSVNMEVATNVSSYFSDPDGDTLAYSAMTSDAAVATARTQGVEVFVTGIGPGTATVTIAARDPGGLSATQEMSVEVVALNRPPKVVGEVDDQALAPGDTLKLDAAQLFEDPDGDSLAFAVTTRDSLVATVAVIDSTVIQVVAVGAGSTMVGIEATDQEGDAASLMFTVTVAAPNQAPVISDSIPAQELLIHDTVEWDLSGHFSDPDSDPLTFAVVSSDTGVASAVATDGTAEIVALAAGAVTVTVSATDPHGMSVAQAVAVTVSIPPPTVADTIPTHDLLVDSMVSLDLAPYFDGSALSFAVSVSDESIAVAMIDGDMMVTKGVGVLAGDTVSRVVLTVSAEGPSGESALQDSVLVRVHGQPYDTLPGLSVVPDGRLEFSSLKLATCIRLSGFPFMDRLITVHWSEWQRAVGGGWVTVQDNEKANSLAGSGNSVCPINLSDDQFPAGRYRMIGHVQLGDDAGYYTTGVIEKEP